MNFSGSQFGRKPAIVKSGEREVQRNLTQSSSSDDWSQGSLILMGKEVARRFHNSEGQTLGPQVFG